MPYDGVINREDVGSMVPTEVSYELLNALPETSFLMRMGRRLRDMTVYETELPVLSALATAYFPDGDKGLVQTTDMAWTDVTIYAKDVSCIVPLPKNVLSDSRVPIWSQVQPEMRTAAGTAIDMAMLYAVNKPAAWPTAIVPAAIAAGHLVSQAAFPDLYDAILGESGLFSVVETDGYDVNGVCAHLSMKGKLRGTRDSDGQPIFVADPANRQNYNLGGATTYFPTNGSGSATYPMIAGDWQQLVYSMRQDVYFDIFTEGVIQDASGKIVYNLLQQRMAAMMLTMRLGFAVPNPINRINGNSATRYPFAVLGA
jgi:HK97 family phage major capsid protein